MIVGTARSLYTLMFFSLFYQQVPFVLPQTVSGVRVAPCIPLPAEGVMGGGAASAALVRTRTNGVTVVAWRQPRELSPISNSLQRKATASTYITQVHSKAF